MEEESDESGEEKEEENDDCGEEKQEENDNPGEEEKEESDDSGEEEVATGDEFENFYNAVSENDEGDNEGSQQLGYSSKPAALTHAKHLQSRHE